MTAKEIDIDFIRNYCVQNNHKEWYNAKIQEKLPCQVYPRVVNEEGKKVVDKSQAPKVEMRPITFVQLKADFIKTFFPQLAPKKETKVAKMYIPL